MSEDQGGVAYSQGGLAYIQPWGSRVMSGLARNPPSTLLIRQRQPLVPHLVPLLQVHRRQVDVARADHHVFADARFVLEAGKRLFDPAQLRA